MDKKKFKLVTVCKTKKNGKKVCKQKKVKRSKADMKIVSDYKMSGVGLKRGQEALGETKKRKRRTVTKK
ncbi:MAG: hypothetical protein GY799_10370 [Desulfobulbaceae bacterium]|nr:hypothetical protein [Desulfobulbaceae bacterium]